MADEAQFTGEYIEKDKAVRYFYPTGTAVVKGAAFCVDETMPWTAFAHSTNNDVLPAGFAAEDRESDDTQQDSIGLVKKGRFLLVAGGNVLCGDSVELSATANRITSVPNVTQSNRRINRTLGVAMASGVAGQYILVNVDIKT